MTRWQAWLLHLSNLLVAGTGLVYGYFRYFAEPTDPFAVVNHPWQPAIQHMHIWFAPTLVFMMGVVWQRHVWARYRARQTPRRKTGIELALSFWPMVISGYAVQTAVDDAWRRRWGWLHIATSLLWVGGYLAHQFLKKPLDHTPTRAVSDELTR